MVCDPSHRLWDGVVQGPGSSEGTKVDWLEFANARAAVVEDVRTIRLHPLVPKRIPIYGYVYDVKTGRLDEVPEATKIGVTVS